MKLSSLILRGITGLCLLLILGATYYRAPWWGLPALFMLFLAIIMLYEIKNLKLQFFHACIYPIAPFIALIIATVIPSLRIQLPMLFVTVFSYETGAFSFGSIMGKRALMPRVSPQKTWEGVIGGFITSSIVGYSFIQLSSSVLSLNQWSVLCPLFVFGATIGDLYESYLKRKAHIKDSGSLLPGHGGLLDRFDGILGAIPFLYCAIPFLC